MQLLACSVRVGAIHELPLLFARGSINCAETQQPTPAFAHFSRDSIALGTIVWGWQLIRSMVVVRR
jgi:hypothetical protein